MRKAIKIYTPQGQHLHIGLLKVPKLVEGNTFKAVKEYVKGLKFDDSYLYAFTFTNNREYTGTFYRKDQYIRTAYNYIYSILDDTFYKVNYNNIITCKKCKYDEFMTITQAQDEVLICRECKKQY